MQKFLVIQTAFTGDVVLATVVAEQLHQDFPDAQIDFLLRKGNETLLESHPFIHEVLIWDKKNNKTKNLLKILSYIRQKKYDKVINLQRFLSTGLLTALSRAKEKVGFDKNPLSFLFSQKIKHLTGDKENPVHETERNLSLINSFSKGNKAVMRLYPARKNENEVAAYKTEEYICIAPASVWFTKQFPKEKWIEFLKLIPTHFAIYFIGAKSDESLCNEIINKLPTHKTENFCGRLSFLSSAALMKDAVMNYANDSAPVHIAGAVNAPVTEIYCSTIPAFGYGPLSKKSFIVETNEPLKCRPCGIHGKKQCPEKHFKCAYTITEKQLLETLD